MTKEEEEKVKKLTTIIFNDIKKNAEICNRSSQPNNPTNRTEIINAFKKHSEEDDSQIILECTESSDICKLLIEKIGPADKQIVDVSTSPKITPNPLDINSLDWSRYKLRHYTSKNPNSFNGKVKSCLTLTMEQELKGISQAEQDQSGHTNPADWNRIGNVGDTFFCLFFDDKEITGTAPAFLKKCHYYIEWNLNQLANNKDFWASLDWLDPQNGKQNLRAYSGTLPQIIFTYFIRNAIGAKIASAMLQRQINIPDIIFKGLRNFEIKKHGSLEFNKGQIHSC